MVKWKLDKAIMRLDRCEFVTANGVRMNHKKVTSLGGNKYGDFLRIGYIAPDKANPNPCYTFLSGMNEEVDIIGTHMILTDFCGDKVRLELYDVLDLVNL